MPSFKPLTPEQFQKAQSAGFSLEQIVEFEKRRKVDERATEMKGFKNQDAELRKEANKSVARRFGQQAFQMLASAPAKIAVSVAEIPGAVKSSFTPGGDASQREYKIPGLDPFKSFLSQGRNVFDKVESGERPFSDAPKFIGEVVLAGIETAALGKGLVGDKVLTGINKGLVTKGLIPKVAPKVANAAKSAVSSTKGTFTKLGERNAFESALKAIKPSVKAMTKKEKIALLKQSGKTTQAGSPRGVESKGILGKLQPVTTEQDIEMAKVAAKAGVRSSFTPDKNIGLLNRKIAEIGDEVRPVLERVNRAFSPTQIGNRFKDVSKNSTNPRYIEIFSDPVRQRAYEKTGETITNMVGKSSGRNLTDLWDTRMQVDDIFSQTKNPAIKQAWFDYRNVINDYIAELVPDGGNVFLGSLKEMSKLFKAIESIAMREGGTLGKNMISRFIGQHPFISTAIGTGVGTTAAGRFIKGLVP